MVIRIANFILHIGFQTHFKREVKQARLLGFEQFSQRNRCVHIRERIVRRIMRQTIGHGEFL